MAEPTVTDFALYVNPKGQPVTHSSYSGRSDFKKCPRYFELTRVQGWMDKEKRAAPLFGKCIEAGLEYFEGLDRTAGTAVSRFTELWQAVTTIPEFKELIYSDKEKDWVSLNRAGQELMRLYELLAPQLPISISPKALYQQVLRKKVFPNTKYDKLENKAIFDVISFPRWNHSMLPAIKHADGCEYQPQSAEHEQIDCTCGAMDDKSYRALIIDIKTSGVDLDTTYVRLDPQLTEYAWMSRIPDIAFLWFVKKSHSLRYGSHVSLLVPVRFQPAGKSFIVLRYDSKAGKVYLGQRAQLEAYDKALEGLRGKAADAVERRFLAGNIKSGDVLLCRPNQITKQRIQFAAARMTQADMDEIGKDVAQTTVEMIRAKEENYYPKLAGIRFPNQKCQFCSMRAICLGDADMREKTLSRKGDEWLEEAFEGDLE